MSNSIIIQALSEKLTTKAIFEQAQRLSRHAPHIILLENETIYALINKTKRLTFKAILPIPAQYLEQHLNLALEQGFALPDALTLAVALTSYFAKTGQHCLVDQLPAEYFPQTFDLDFPLNPPECAFAKTEFKLGLYPVVDSIEWIERLIASGVKTMQLRLKNYNEMQAEPQIMQAIQLAKKHHIRLFINDFWQLATKYKAYGVHLGQEDLATADLNAIAKAGLRLGVSTHGYFEIMRLKALNPSYIALGHIFPTQTKAMPSQPQGITNLARYVNCLPNIPTVAIGGIKAHHFKDILATNVGSIAVVTAITQAEDWQQAVNQLQNLMEG